VGLMEQDLFTARVLATSAVDVVKDVRDGRLCAQVVLAGQVFERVDAVWVNAVCQLVRALGADPQRLRALGVACEVEQVLGQGLGEVSEQVLAQASVDLAHRAQDMISGDPGRQEQVLAQARWYLAAWGLGGTQDPQTHPTARAVVAESVPGVEVPTKDETP